MLYYHYKKYFHLENFAYLSKIFQDLQISS